MNEKIKMMALDEDELEQVVGGMTTADIPFYGEVKQFYFEKGAGAAFMYFIYYHPTPFGYQVIENIEKEIKEGNRGYTLRDGTYYECPESDPYFKDRRIINTLG